MDRMMNALLDKGFEAIDYNDYTGQGFQIKAGCGTLKIYIKTSGHGFTARLDKPNGTHKWLVEKSHAQIIATINQTMSFYCASWR